MSQIEWYLLELDGDELTLEVAQQPSHDCCLSKYQQVRG